MLGDYRSDQWPPVSTGTLAVLRGSPQYLTGDAPLAFSRVGASNLGHLATSVT